MQLPAEPHGARVPALDRLGDLISQKRVLTARDVCELVELELFDRFDRVKEPIKGGFSL